MRSHDADRDPVHSIEQVIKIDTPHPSHNLRSHDADRDPVHSIERVIKIDTLLPNQNVRSPDPDPVHSIERVIKIDTSHNVRSHDPDRDPVHRIKGIVLPDQDLCLKFQHHHRVDSQYCQGYHTHFHHGGL